VEASQPAAERLAIRRDHPTALTGAGLGVHHVERDLTAMQIKTALNRHLTSPLENLPPRNRAADRRSTGIDSDGARPRQCGQMSPS
jgi:hypothetical protein